MSSQLPPNWIGKLLRAVCKEHLVEEIEGDLLEFYSDWVSEYGSPKANRLYLIHAIKFLRPFAIKTFTNKYNHTNMFKNYLSIAWRVLLKNKMYSSIKIGGFAIGIAAFILISFFIIDELSYDKFYQDQEQIYRVVNDYKNEDKWASFPAPAAEIVRSNFPEIAIVGRLIPYMGWFNAGDNQLRKEGDPTNYYEEGFAYADPELLEILEVKMVRGDRKNALSKPNSILISQRKAEKYFPGQDPIGKQLILNDDEETSYVIGGVMENFSSKSHIDFDFLITLFEHEFWPGEQGNWCCWNYDMYLKLKPTADPAELEGKFKVIAEYVARFNERVNPAEAEENRKYLKYILQPVDQIYLLGSDEIYDAHEHGTVKIVWLFSAIAALVLMLACVNFINLSTARSANRSKEVGIRKVSGSSRQSLVQQFLTESFLVCLLSVVISLCLIIVILPYFNEITEKSLVIPWASYWFIPSIAAFILLVTFLSGLYPSFYLSAFRPIEVLKGSLSQGSKNSTVRSVMVVFQFVVSVILIVGALLVYQQLDYILNKDIGFDKEQVMIIQGVDTMGEKNSAFKEELKKIADVKSASISNYLPISGTRRDSNEFWPEGKRDEGSGSQMWTADKDYIEVMGMRLKEGRSFQDMVSDSASLIINEEFAKRLQLESPLLGKRVANFERTWTIIGVVENFHFESMKNNIGPLAISNTDNGDVMVVKLQSNDLINTVESVSEVWAEFMPNQAIRFNFLDDSFEHMYASITRTVIVFTAFAVLAILVACLGLFGLSTFIVEQRRKEISIRKVLGANLQNIFGLLTINFLKMILVALIIAIPVSVIVMRRWLEDFEYAVGISWEIFVIGAFLLTIISLATISFEVLKAARVNPTEGLNSE